MFDIDEREKRVCYASPHKGVPGEGFIGFSEDWDSVLKKLRAWLVDVKREHLEPDLWRVVSAEKLLIAPELEKLGNDPFSEAEIRRIADSIKELRQFLVSTGEYSKSQLSFIDSRLIHLEQSSHRLGRKDWITLAMGTLVNIIVGVALAPDAARELVRSAGNLFGWITSNLHLLL